MRKEGYLVILASAVGTICIASAASAFDAITIVNPFMKACWRVQLNAFCYFGCILFTWKTNKMIYKSLLKTDLKTMIISGIFQGSHFCLWTLSLELTSVAHSLLFLCSTPLLIVAYHLITCKPIRKLEIVGVLIGFSGMIIICLGGENSEGSTIEGDLIALAGSFAIWFHFAITEKLLSDQPFMCLFIIHLSSAIFCFFVSLIYSICIYGASGFSVGGQIVAYLYNIQGLYAIYLGVVVGFIGNGSLYYVLKHTSPLVLTVIVFFEPVFGSIFAWICGFQREPSMFTWIGGSVIFVGNSIVSIFTKLKPERKDNEIHDSLANESIST